MSATKEFQDRLETTLTEKGVPAQFGSEILIELLMELLIGLSNAATKNLYIHQRQLRLTGKEFLEDLTEGDTYD